jgi:hypothetical protein
MSPSARPSHHSNTSSATSQPDNVITSTHTSAASTDFPTNATVTDTPQAEGRKKKKNNKNKKKNRKKTSAPIAEESTPDDGKGNAVPSNYEEIFKPKSDPSPDEGGKTGLIPDVRSKRNDTTKHGLTQDRNTL